MVELLAMVAAYSTREVHDGLHDGTRSRRAPRSRAPRRITCTSTALLGFTRLRLAEDRRFLQRQFLWLVPITQREKDGVTSVARHLAVARGSADHARGPGQAIKRLTPPRRRLTDVGHCGAEDRVLARRNIGCLPDASPAAGA